MGWETIDNVKPKYTKTDVPAHGIVVGTRSALHGKRYITIRIGAALAQGVRITRETQAVRLMFGSGIDAGKVGVSVDVGGASLRSARRAAPIC